jgi:hypothetical protein
MSAPIVEPTADATEAQQQGDPAELGNAGKKALDAERTARSAAEKSARDLQARLDAIEAQNMSDLERAQKQAADAAAEAQAAKAEALRYRIASKHQIGDEDADLFLTGTDEETLTRQAARLAERYAAAAAPGTPRPDPSQGARGSDLALNGDPLLRDLKSKLGIT